MNFVFVIFLLLFCNRGIVKIKIEWKWKIFFGFDLLGYWIFFWFLKLVYITICSPVPRKNLIKTNFEFVCIFPVELSMLFCTLCLRLPDCTAFRLISSLSLWIYPFTRSEFNCNSTSESNIQIHSHLRLLYVHPDKTMPKKWAEERRMCSESQ